MKFETIKSQCRLISTHNALKKLPNNFSIFWLFSDFFIAAKIRFFRTIDISLYIYTPHALFCTSLFLLFVFFCRFFENEGFFTVYLLRVHAFFVEILKMKGKKRHGGV